MRLARIEMIFQREEEIALKVLKYSTGTMRRWGIDIRGRTEPPGPVPGSERGGCAGSAAGPRGASGPGSVPLPCTCHQGLVATEGSQAQRARGHQGLEATKSLWPTKTCGHQKLVVTKDSRPPRAHGHRGRTAPRSVTFGLSSEAQIAFSSSSVARTGS